MIDPKYNSDECLIEEVENTCDECLNEELVDDSEFEE